MKGAIDDVDETKITDHDELIKANDAAWLLWSQDSHII